MNTQPPGEGSEPGYSADMINTGIVGRPSTVTAWYDRFTGRIVGYGPQCPKGAGRDTECVLLTVDDQLRILPEVAYRQTGGTDDAGARRDEDAPAGLQLLLERIRANFVADGLD